MVLGAEFTVEFPSSEDVPGEFFLFIYLFIHEKELELSHQPPPHPPKKPIPSHRGSA